MTPGQFAQYKLQYYNCQPTYSLPCQLDPIGLGDFDWGALRVIDVSGTNVTLSIILVYKNGTATEDGALVNVDTGFSNITSFATGTPTNHFVLAGNLQVGNRVWNTDDAPTLNKTLTQPVLGAPREVNLLNFTTTYSYLELSLVSAMGIAFDRESGVFIEIVSSLSGTGPYGSFQIEFAVRMVDNNIWLDSSLPDFSLDANPATVNVDQGSLGTSTITITRTDSFFPTITLTATSSPNTLNCSFSHRSLAAGSSDTSTLSCTGSPGTYTVTVMANGGYTSHEKSVTFVVASPVRVSPLKQHRGSE